MPLTGPLVVISEFPAHELVAAVTKAGAFPVVEARWVDAVAAVTSVEPSAVIVADTTPAEPKISAGFGERILLAEPYLPVIAQVQEDTPLPYRGALPIAARLPAERLIARLGAALRVRELHATVLRRRSTLTAEQKDLPALPKTDPLDDATVLVLGRGRSYPALSVAVGERVGVIGALSVEAAGKCLSARAIDGIIIGDGFSPRIIDAFLLVLAEDARFRDLAVGVLGDGLCPEQMPNIVREREVARLVERTLQLTRLHALDARLKRMLNSVECKGMLDPETGLLNEHNFGQDLSRAIDHAAERGGGLSIARFSFDSPLDRRSSLDAARVIGRIMRKVDFACQQDDGSILTVFTGTDLRMAHVVARRLASVVKHTMVRADRELPPIGPNVTLATLKPDDTVLTLMARVSPRAVAAG